MFLLAMTPLCVAQKLHSGGSFRSSSLARPQGHAQPEDQVASQRNQIFILFSIGGVPSALFEGFLEIRDHLSGTMVPGVD